MSALVLIEFSNTQALCKDETVLIDVLKCRVDTTCLGCLYKYEAC